MGILRVDRIAGLGGANAITGSVFFGGGEQVSGQTNNNILITEVSSDFTFGTGDFTIEGWFYTPDLSNWNLLVGDNVYQSTGGWSLYFNTDPDVDWWKGGSSVVSGATPTTNTWHHVAFSRESGTNRVFLDGALGASASDSTNYTGTQILIGANQLIASTNVSQWGFKGFASNVRVIKGEAIYTAAFTAPTTRLEKTDNTVLLCCQSPGNILQEATGKKLYTLNKPVASHFTPNSPVGFSTTTDVGSQYGSTFDGFGNFATSTYMVPPGGNTRERNRGRGVFAGGYATGPASLRNIIDYVEIQTTGNAIDFGDLLSINNGESGACSSPTRALYGGGQSNTVDITFITIANTSNATDFGDLITGRRSLSAVSSDTRGLFAGGTTPAMKNEIEFVTIATAGNASDFGDLTVGRRNMAPNSSSTRGLFAGGNPGSSPLQDDTIDYITIASAGNATDFGNLITAMREQGGSSSATRGLIAGGYTAPANLNTIEFITIASTGNASDFGDLHIAVSGLSGTSNGTRGIFAGGSYINNIQYVTISSTGDAADFGDLTAPRFLYDGTSDSHGGLS